MRKTLIVLLLGMAFLILLGTSPAGSSQTIQSVPVSPQQAMADINWIAMEHAKTTWLFGVEAQRQLDSRLRASSGGGTARSYGGPHSDQWWMGVARCEQGGRNDEYFGYFSFMDGSAAGKSWAEQVAMGNAVLARSRSESPAWAPSCVAAGYTASPGG
jgi:hypothetical protein